MRLLLIVAAHGLVAPIRKAPLKYHATAADLDFMREALDLAQTVTADTTAPNPQVGCVLVQNNKIVGRGFHPKAGEPHAEIFALRDAGATVEREGDADHWSVASPLKNATAYVTLEPCSHVGKTPPCCDALVAAGCGRVVIGMSDPAPWVAGNGAQRLRDGGVDVEVLEDAACLALLEGWVASLNLEGK